MLKGDKLNAPYFSLACSSINGPQISSIHTRSNQNNSKDATKESETLLLSTNSNGGSSSGVCLTNASGQKVTRRVAHEICEKRKLEEQEIELSKRVKTEGDVNELIIKELVQVVEAELADVENGVGF